MSACDLLATLFDQSVTRNCSMTNFLNNHKFFRSLICEGNSIRECVLMDVYAPQPPDHGFEPHTGQDHDSSYDTSTGWLNSDLNKLWELASQLS